MTDVVQSSVIDTSPISKAEIETLKKLYIFRESTEIIQFLTRYPFLVPLLLEAKEVIIQYFPDAVLFLEYLPDPEIDNHLLALHIETELESEEAMDRLDKLYTNWWINVSVQSQGKLCIDVE